MSGKSSNVATPLKPATNRPHILTSINVDKNFIEMKLKGKIEMPKPPEPPVDPEVELDKLVEQIANELKGIFLGLIPLTDRPYVMMKNKALWYDKATAGLFPKFESITFPSVQTINDPIRNWGGLRHEGFNFVLMTPEEIQRSFIKGRDNPYMDRSGAFTPFNTEQPYTQYIRNLLSNDRNSSGQSHLINIDGRDFFWRDSDYVSIIPIFRLGSPNSSGLSAMSAIKAWLYHKLIPQDLPSTLETKYNALLEDYQTLSLYIKDAALNADNALDKARLRSDLKAGKLKKNILGIDVGKPKEKPKVKPPTLNESNLLAAVKKYLCNCDYIRANIMPYDENRLVDINLGHWELFEDLNGADNVEAESGKPLVARPPQLDINSEGVCAIDFGTKSTVVACLDRDARLLRIGMGDYKKAATLKDYENPTVMQFIELDKFIEAYGAREGRPYTEWKQLTVSHEAANALEANSQSLQDSAVYYSVFGELKQWANDKNRRLSVRDSKGSTPKDLPPYLELQAGDFDPIEVYAYYLGLNINNMHNQIYLDYLLSFPVTYEQEVRERIRQSFERGLRKSLPPAVLADEERMKEFRVLAGASEPAAYAISALQEYKLEPREPGERVAYAVFDLGGGTTDFDFGVEYIPRRRRSKFEIEQFENGGNPHLGGERILDRLAYEVYKLNLDKMREKQIQFVLPIDADPIAGVENLILRSGKASQKSRMNSYILANEMRPYWERSGDWEKFGERELKVSLFSSAEGKELESMELKLDRAVLDECIEENIQTVVMDFFTALFNAFQNHDLVPIHIFLAGNSCRSEVVQQIFKETMQSYEQLLKKDIRNIVEKETDNLQIFKLYPPLGQKFYDEPSGAQSAQPSAANATDTLHFDKVRTGKTGVAFGLLRSRPSGRDVKIVSAAKEADFPYYLGEIDYDERFRVLIGKDVEYKVWRRFTYADLPEFELYYTKQAKALSLDDKDKLRANEVRKMKLRLDADELSDDDDMGVYICKLTPDTIAYATGREEDFRAGNYGGKKHEVRLAEER